MQSRTCRSGPPTANLLSTFRLFDPGDYKQRARSLDAFQIPARQNTNSYRLQPLLDVDLFRYQQPSQSLQSEELRLRSVSTAVEVGEPPPDPPDPVVSLRDPKVEMPGSQEVPVPMWALDAVVPGFNFISYGGDETDELTHNLSVPVARDKIKIHEIVGASLPPNLARRMAQKELEMNPEGTVEDLQWKLEAKLSEFMNKRGSQGSVNSQCEETEENWLWNFWLALEDDKLVELMQKATINCDVIGCAEDRDCKKLDDWSDEKLVELMQKATNCDVVGCEDKDCKKAKQLVQDLERSLRDISFPPKPLPVNHQQVLRAVARHAIDCDSVRCCVPWCMIMQAYDDNEAQEMDGEMEIEYLVAKLHRFYVSRELGKAEDLPYDDNAETFVQIDNNVEWPSSLCGVNPRCGLDYEVLTFDVTGIVGHIVSNAMSFTLPPMPVAILQYETQDWTESTWSKLRNIADVHWVKVGERHVTVCSRLDLSADSLANEMQRCNGSLLPPVKMWSYLLDIANIMNQLHTAGVLCLNFDASRIQLCKNLTVAKLADFSSAVDESFSFDDVTTVETILQLLPPEAVPPEMFADGDIGKHSDIWLFGCLFYHMATGVRLHHEDRHLSHDEMRKWVRHKDRPPDLSGIEGCEILERILVDKSKRIQLPELISLVEEQLHQLQQLEAGAQYE